MFGATTHRHRMLSERAASDHSAVEHNVAVANVAILSERNDITRYKIQLIPLKFRGLFKILKIFV